MSEAKEKQSLDAQGIKQSIKVSDYAASFTTLVKESAKEWAGPCPKCGGDDRFHCKEEWFFCRQCHPNLGDIIEFVQWKDGVKFMDAVSILSGVDLDTLTKMIGSDGGKRKQIEPQSDEWRKRSNWTMSNACQSLHNESGKDGREYLASRGLSPETWKAFGLGFKIDAPLPGTFNKETKSYCYPQQSAIAMPWFDTDGKIAAIRYRFTQKHTYTDVSSKLRKDENKSSVYGSDFAGRLCGYHVLSKEKKDRTLFIVEGEINMMSIWQLANKMGVDVLSIGSQGQKPVDVASVANQYKHTIVWADETGVASRLAATIDGAYAVSSPKGMDANDLLKSGKLGGYLAAWRYSVCKTDEDINLLRQWLTSAVESGIADRGTIKVLTGINEKHPQQTTNHPVWLTELSCYAEYAACTARVEKNGLLFKLWENEGALADDERRLMAYLEEELGAPVTQR